MQTREVIVIGGNHHNTLGVIRALGEKGIVPNLILVTKGKRPFVSYSRYLKRVVLIPNDEMIPKTLLDEFKEVDSPPVVICCSDSSAGLLDSQRHKLIADFILPGSDEEGRISFLMSKKQMSELALKVGMKIPQTCYGEDIGTNEIIPLPCIIKPIVSMKGKKSDIHICHTWDDVHKRVSEVGIGNVQIQHFINKDYEYQLIGCSTGKEIIIPGVSIIKRPCKGSNTSFLHYIPLADDFCDINKCKTFVEETGYKGLFSLEFLRDKSGEDYFMEINFRNDGNAICVTASGVNLPYIWYMACIGKDYRKELERTVRPVYVMPDLAELKLFLTGKISIVEYISDLFKTNRFMEYDKDDPKPFWRMVRAKLHLW
jgi:predicted ATP-grasp superfamily ATP-dependent carboligase